MNKDVYLSWLTDRGIDPPSGQPFEFIDGHLDANASLVLVALVDGNSHIHLESIRKLAHAVCELNKSISWLAITAGVDVDVNTYSPSPVVLRNLMPALSKIVYLTCDEKVAAESSDQLVQRSPLASRPMEIMIAPTIKVLSENLDLKRKFWQSIKEWLLA